jgi:glycine cleavage system H protein
MYPEDLKYSETHEWVRVEKDSVTIGLSSYAIEQLGDIVFLELPNKGDKVKQSTEFGTIESVKTVSELNAPVSGTITAVNTALIDNYDVIQNDPFQKGWILKIKLSDEKELKKLMDSKKYSNHTKSE